MIIDKYELSSGKWLITVDGVTDSDCSKNEKEADERIRFIEQGCKTACSIEVHFSGVDTSLNRRLMTSVQMEAEPEESLRSIVDRIPCPLVEIKVKAIQFLD